MSVSQGELAKACVAELISFCGLTLSDCHSSHMEMTLTNFVVSQMMTEGSTFYRSEAAAQGSQEEPDHQTKKNSKRKSEGKEERPKAKAKGKNKGQTKEVEENVEDDEAAGEEVAEDTSDQLPW